MNDTYSFIYYDAPEDTWGTEPIEYIINEEELTEEEVVKNLLFVIKDMSKCVQVFRMYKSLTFNLFIQTMIESFIPKRKILHITANQKPDATKIVFLDLNDSTDRVVYHTIPRSSFRDPITISADELSYMEEQNTFQDLLSRIEALEAEIEALRNSR